MKKPGSIVSVYLIGLDHRIIRCIGCDPVLLPDTGTAYSGRYILWYEPDHQRFSDGADHCVADRGDHAQKYLDSTPIIRGINGTELVDLILKYYEDLSEKYRKMIPLKMVYIPVPKEE